MPLPLLTSQYLVEEWTQVFLNITFFSLFCPGWFWFQNGIIPHPPTTHPINHNNDTEVGLHRKEIFCDGGADLEWQFVWRSGYLILYCIAPPSAQKIFIGTLTTNILSTLEKMLIFPCGHSGPPSKICVGPPATWKPIQFIFANILLQQFARVTWQRPKIQISRGSFEANLDI